MKLEKPIFIIGTGRCGSTIFHNIFGHHPEVYWLSSLLQKYPNKIWMNQWLMKLIDLPLFGPYLINKIKPDECYYFWDNLYRGFSNPFRDLNEKDLTIKNKELIRKVFCNMITKKRKRLIVKITGWSRVRFIHEIFPDAKFIHVLRDGRAFANSVVNVKFWRGWNGPNNWRWGVLNKENQKSWEKYDKSFIILAAIHWKILIDSVEKTKKILPKSQFFEMRYEDLMEDSVSVFKETTKFCDLNWTKNFEDRIKTFKLKNMNYKWQENFTKDQQKNLNEFLKPYLRKYGYSINGGTKSE